ncbi:MAG: hypothetical protein ACLQJR_35480 [Stellaceae bacterium]
MSVGSSICQRPSAGPVGLYGSARKPPLMHRSAENDADRRLAAEKLEIS